MVILAISVISCLLTCVHYYNYVIYIISDFRGFLLKISEFLIVSIRCPAWNCCSADRWPWMATWPPPIVELWYLGHHLLQTGGFLCGHGCLQDTGIPVRSHFLPLVIWLKIPWGRRWGIWPQCDTWLSHQGKLPAVLMGQWIPILISH